MRIACPVDGDAGLDSRICGHFGSAPGFVVVDTASMSPVYIVNPSASHSHGMCQPIAAFGDSLPDAVVAAGMGAGALSKLRAAGVEVYLSALPTVKETVDGVVSGRIAPADPASACSMHHGEHGGGCGHS